MKRELFHLLLDYYSAHGTMDFQALAVQLGIMLHYIPAGGTDHCHPLDLLISGALKSMA
jgi:hypothetical protein